MKVRSVFLLVVFAAVCVFAALNWKAFTAPTDIFLAFGNVQAPLGLIMLALTAFLVAVFMIFAAFIQTSALFEASRHERELQSMRQLAESAEASRFTKLEESLKTETRKLADAGKGTGAEIVARIDRLESALTSSVEQSGNTLAAYIGELEDRLVKSGRSDLPGDSA